jgi:hypothetical protein
MKEVIMASQILLAMPLLDPALLAAAGVRVVAPPIRVF